MGPLGPAVSDQKDPFELSVKGGCTYSLSLSLMANVLGGRHAAWSAIHLAPSIVRILVRDKLFLEGDGTKSIGYKELQMAL